MLVVGLGEDPFDEARLKHIFRVSQRYPNRLVTREGTNIEFKESFSWANRARYARTLASFGNVSGGYIVFGVTNSPRTLKGLDNPNRFEDLSPDTVSQYLNDHFAPAMSWRMHMHEIDGKMFGLLFVYQAETRPVICIKDDGNDLRSGDIYYRYGGRTERIRYPELRRIIEDERRREIELFIRHVTTVAEAGARNVAVMNTITGNVSGPRGMFIIDKALLPKIKFVREGQFHEVKGAPTLRLVGDLETVPEGGIQAVRLELIRIQEIIEAFLHERPVPNPKEFIQAMCFESTGYLPIYYFLYLDGMSLEEALHIVKETKSRATGRRKLEDRLTRDYEDFSITLPTTQTVASQRKRMLAERIKRNDVPQDLDVEDLRYFLQAIRLLTADEINRDYLFPILWDLFHRHYFSGSSSFADEFRRTICHLDVIYYRHRVL